MWTRIVREGNQLCVRTYEPVVDCFTSQSRSVTNSWLYNRYCIVLYSGRVPVANVPGCTAA